MDERLEQIVGCLNRADRALGSGRKPDASRALGEAEPIMAAYLEEGPTFLGLVTIQAARMAVDAGDEARALDFSTHLLREIAGLLGTLVEEHRATFDTGQQEDLERAHRAIFKAFAIAGAFVPFVESLPQGLLAATIGGMPADDGSRAAAQVGIQVRQRLDASGWAGWAYPPELASEARRLSAYALTHVANAWQANHGLGSEVAEAIKLTDLAETLLVGAAPGRLLVETLNTRARGLMALGGETHEEAARCFRRAQAIAREIGEPDMAMVDRGNLGAICVELASMARANGDTAKGQELEDEADRCLEAAAAYHRRGPAPRHLLAVLNAQATLDTNRGKIDQAGVKYREAWDLVTHHSQEETSDGIAILGNLASNLLEQERWAEAEDLLRQAEAALDWRGRGISATVPEREAMILGHLGDALLGQDRVEEALGYLGRSIDRLEEYARSYVSARMGIELPKRFRWVYESMIDACARRGEVRPELREKAFLLAETLRWRTLTVFLRFDLGLRLLALNPDPEAEQLLDLESGLLRQAFPLLGPSRQSVADGFEYQEIMRRLEGIWDRLEPRYPDYVAIRRQGSITARGAAGLLDEQVPILLEYYLGDENDTSLAFVVARGDPTPRIVRLDVKLEDLAERVRGLLPAVGARGPSLAEYLGRSRELHRLLIEPVLPLIPEGSGVCVIPSGPLHALAFASLHDGQRYLVERNPLVIAPGATALRWWAGKNLRNPERCLIFTATSGIPGRLDDLDQFADLARGKIVPLFRDPPAVLIEGEAATRPRLLEMLAGGADSPARDVIHIACHGHFDAEKPFESRLELAASTAVGDKDLTAMTIFSQVRLGATLVTLSACESGVPHVAQGENIVGLAQSFLFAGASSVLATLWNLRQDVGVAQTKRFYQLWKGDGKASSRPQTGRQAQPSAVGKLEAFHRAQCETLRARSFWIGPKTWAHPHQWAAFQLYGDWR